MPAMFECNTRLIHFASLALTLAAAACSDGNAGSDTAVTDAGNLFAAGVSFSDPHACIVTTSTPAPAGAEPGPSQLAYRWLSYAADAHVVGDIAIDEKGQPLALDAAANTSTYARLNAAGRTLVRAVEAGAGELQRTDYRRDSHGNVISRREARTRTRDLSVGFPEEPSAAYDYLNKYDASGLLRSHDRSDSSLSIGYAHDASGRCEYVFGADYSERREYDASGHLGSQSFEPALDRDLGADPLASFVIVHRYDEGGRRSAIEQDGGGRLALPIDGQADIQTLWSYGADGSVQIETVDFTSDQPNAVLEREEQPQSARQHTELWSPGCAAVRASIPSPVGQGCSAD